MKKLNKKDTLTDKIKLVSQSHLAMLGHSLAFQTITIQPFVL